MSDAEAHTRRIARVHELATSIVARCEVEAAQHRRNLDARAVMEQQRDAADRFDIDVRIAIRRMLAAL